VFVRSLVFLLYDRFFFYFCFDRFSRNNFFFYFRLRLQYGNRYFNFFFRFFCYRFYNFNRDFFFYFFLYFNLFFNTFSIIFSSTTAFSSMIGSLMGCFSTTGISTVGVGTFASTFTSECFSFLSKSICPTDLK